MVLIKQSSIVCYKTSLKLKTNLLFWNNILKRKVRFDSSTLPKMGENKSEFQFQNI